jgi:hypothetical protein
MPTRLAIDKEALELARSRLGIQDPVVVSIVHYKDPDIHGRYVDHRSGKHRISLAHDNTVKQASRSLWHELVHARQVELLGFEKWDARWQDEMQRQGISQTDARQGAGKIRKYRRTFLEREAELLAKEFSSQYPLVKRRGRRSAR